MNRSATLASPTTVRKPSNKLGNRRRRAEKEQSRPRPCRRRRACRLGKGGCQTRRMRNENTVRFDANGGHWVCWNPVNPVGGALLRRAQENECRIGHNNSRSANDQEDVRFFTRHCRWAFFSFPFFWRPTRYRVVRYRVFGKPFSSRPKSSSYDGHASTEFSAKKSAVLLASTVLVTGHLKKTKVNFLATTEIVQMCVFSRVFFPPATRLPSFTELTVFVRDWLLGFDIPLIFLKNGALLGCFLSCPRYFVRGKSFLLDGLVHRCSTISTDSFMLDLVWWNFTVS